jgi:hypothetical protein
MPALAANPQTSPWRTWYSLQRWRKRAKHQLRIEPLCRQCLAAGRTTPATIADHVVPHRGDWNAFRLGALQSCVAIAMLANGPTIGSATAQRSATTASRSMSGIHSMAGERRAGPWEDQSSLLYFT